MQQSALLQAKAYYLVKPTEFGSSLLILKRDGAPSGPVGKIDRAEGQSRPNRQKYGRKSRKEQEKQGKIPQENWGRASPFLTEKKRS